MKMKNNAIVCGFSVEPYSSSPARPGNGFLLSVSRKKKYELLADKRGACVLKYDPYCFTFGNNDIKLFSKGEITSIFGMPHSSFAVSGTDSS